MVRPDERGGFIESISDPNSNREQLDVFSIEIPNSDEAVDIAMGYRRCLDFDEGNQPGQDFAIVRGGDGYVVGVVADGVSQSFYGDIAAQHVTGWLLNELWTNRKRPPDQEQLEVRLKMLEAKVSELVEAYPLPRHLPDMHRQALESVRRDGSQAVFAAFVLDGKNKHLRLYQVGDVIALIHFPQSPPEAVTAPPKGRWSSAGMSKLQLNINDYKGATGIVIKSDGAGADWGIDLRSGALNRETFHGIAQARAGVDDVSFIAAAFRRKDEAGTFINSQISIDSPISGFAELPPGIIPTEDRAFKDRRRRGDESNDEPDEEPVEKGRSWMRGITTLFIIAALGGAASLVLMEVFRSLLTGEIPAKRITPEDLALSLSTGITYGLLAGVALISIIYLLLIWIVEIRGGESKNNGELEGSTQATRISRTMNVNMDECSRADFFNRYANHLSRGIGSRRDTKMGEALACIHLEGINPTKIELMLERQAPRFKDRIKAAFGASRDSVLQAIFYNPGGKPQEVGVSIQHVFKIPVNIPNKNNVVAKSLFVLLPGLTQGVKVPLRIRLMEFDNSVYEANLSLRGRQKERMQGDRFPFGGYYEIRIARR